MDDLVKRLIGYIAMMAPHQRSRQSGTMLIECLDAIERLTAELQQQRDSAAWCDKHKPNGGHRAACLVCACVIYSSALSRISYLCGEPNEMECGPYDIHCDESAVVEQVKQLTAERDALQAKLDALMMGCCPDAMTDEQRARLTGDKL